MMAIVVSRGRRGANPGPNLQLPTVPNVGLVPVLPAGPEVRLEIAGAALYDPGNARWEEVDLSRRQNVLEWVGRSPQRQSFTAVFSGEVEGRGGAAEQGPVQSWINQLYEIAIPPPPAEPFICAVNGPLYGNFAGYLWRVESLTPNDDVRRRDSDGEVCYQTFRVVLVRHLDIGIVSTANASPAAAAAERQGADAPAASRTYTVVSGDTLSRIAATELGSAGRWKELADKNQLRDPNLIRPGQVLHLP